jgi:hypothetical protein
MEPIRHKQRFDTSSLPPEMDSAFIDASIRVPALVWIERFKLHNDTPYDEYRPDLVRYLREAGDGEGRIRLVNHWEALSDGKIPGATEAQKFEARACSYLYGYLMGHYDVHLKEQQKRGISN